MSVGSAPIGVFDSGIGGLSVLQALRHELPDEQFVYLADSGHAPYGERGDAFVQARTHAIAQYLRSTQGIKALVIACNTATAAAVESLRTAMPDLPLIGVEPAIKPAAASTQTHRVGVIATRGTVESRRFQKLVEQHGQSARFCVQACDGLARAIERSTRSEQGDAAMAEAQALSRRYLAALGPFGVKTHEMDTLVLGCTHYVFIKDMLRSLVGPEVQIIDTGAAVARQTRRLLQQHALLRSATCAPALRLLTTGELPALQTAAQRWLGISADGCQQVVVDSPATA